MGKVMAMSTSDCKTMRTAIECAIRDREALIDAYAPVAGGKLSEDGKRVIRDCALAIAKMTRLDKRIAARMRKAT